MAYNLPKDTKPFLLGAAAGAVVLAVVGFKNFGWKMDSDARALAKKQSESAVVTALATICVAHFKEAPNYSDRFAALEKVNRYSRGEVVAKSGWATMSGSKEPAPGVGQACADLLIPEKY